MQIGDYPQAIAALDKALQIRPNYGGYNNLGLAQLYQRDYAAAVASFERAVAITPNEITVLGNLARAYYWSPGRRAEAQAAYRRAIAAGEQDLKVNPDDADVHLLMANYYAMLGDRANALTHLAAVLKPGVADAEIQFQAAIVHNQLGERAAALTALETAAARGYSLAELRAAPEFDNLHQEPKFQAVFAKQNPAAKF